MACVTIRQWTGPIEVAAGQSILDAALAAGVPYPHGCQSGNCGSCKSRLYDGEVVMTPYSEFALSDAERDDGLILACRAVPEGDCTVAWLETDEVAAHPMRELECRAVAIDDMTHDIRRVRLRIESGGPFTFSAGQYAAVAFEALAPRDYSMANVPDRDGSGTREIEFHIRHLAGGASGAYVAAKLKPGEKVRVRGPYGSSFLREQHAGPILAIAGGSGLAPIKSIVETALRLGMRQPIGLYFGVRDERDLYLESHFRELAAKHPNLRFTPVLSEPSRPTARRTGFVHEALAADVAGVDGCKAYLAGPPVMVEAATGMLEARGLAREHIHADAFYTEAERVALGGRAVSALDGRVALVTGAARGIGLAIARALAGAGGRVVVADNGTDMRGDGADPKPAREAAAALGEGAVAFTDSIASPAAAKSAVDLAVAHFGGLDIVVNNAAILRDAFVFKADPADWEAVIRTDLSAAFYTIAAATPVMRDQAKASRGVSPYAWGRIVNITSTAGLYGNIGQAAYASAKAGLVGLTRATAMDMARSNVTCNAVAPFAATRVTEQIKPANDAQAQYKARALKVDAGHVARLVLWLCSQAGAKATGQIFGVRGREIFLFSQPRPVARAVDGDPADFADKFTDLRSDLEAFNTDPVV